MSYFFSLDILRRFNRKEPDAVKWVYEQYYPYVLAIVRKMTYNSPDGPDLAADVFIKLLEHPGPFSSLSKIKYFLYTATKNHCIDYLRHQKVLRSKEPVIIQLKTTTEENDLEDVEARGVLHQKIYASMEELPRRCQYIFWLYYAQGLTNREIADKLSISEKTVSNQKTIALKRLKLKISKMNGASVTLFVSFYNYFWHLHHLIPRV